MRCFRPCTVTPHRAQLTTLAVTVLAVFLIAALCVPTFAQARDAAGEDGTAAKSASARRLEPRAPLVVPEEGGRYFSTFWLILLMLQCIFWLGIFDWVGRDMERLGGPQRLWCALMMGVGAAGVALAILAHRGFVLLAWIGLFVAFGIYVWKRNADLPDEKRVFTPDHLRYVFRKVCRRLHLMKGGLEEQAREDATEIVLLRKDGATLEKLTERRGAVGTSEAVVFVKELVESAILSRATDIHMEPKEGELQARYRIDGILHNVPSYPSELASPMMSSIKVLAEMNIAEKRKPQDGTFMARLGKRALDFRVATVPSVHGETMVIRILDRDAGLIRLERLGAEKDHIETIKRVIEYPHGMLIASGPTGSGKTTTLYAMLSELDSFQKNIITIEDPIEYRLDNVTQTQINPKAGVSFAGTLRSSLRQDPDVIMVGEIRDAETARTALQAAMTGHFVFTTLHANDAVTSLFRLLDLGVEPYLISSALSAVVAQRLLRVLCPSCKESYVPSPEFLRKIGVAAGGGEVTFYKAVGCEECQGTGFRGRVGIFELFEVNDAVKELIRTNPSTQLIQSEVLKMGMRKMQEDGVKKVLRGITAVKELVRVTR